MPERKPPEDILEALRESVEAAKKRRRRAPDGLAQVIRDAQAKTRDQPQLGTSCFPSEMALSDEVDELYGLPLDGFTQARNDLARRLRTERKPEAATEVAGLRKPTAAAWVVNQLVRERPEDIRALLAAADEIRAGADGDSRFRESVDRLARSAREILAGAGRTASDHVVQEVVTTLRAVAATEPEALETGRLTEGREASGFDALAGATPDRAPRRRATRPPSKDEAPRPSVDRAAVDAARKALSNARTEARELQRAAVAAEREAERARVAHERAEARVAAAQAELDAARGTGR